VIRLFVADDHAVVRRGLHQVVAETHEMTVAGEAASASEALQRLAEDAYDAVVLDLSLPGGNGLDLLGEIKRRWPRMPVLILTVHSEEQYAVRALRAGAAAYLTKESAPEELQHALRKVVRGGRYVTAAVAERLAFTLGPDADRPLHEGLSDREFQVLRMLASGKAVSQIAEELHLSVKTVSTYRTRVLEKMEMKSNAELTHYAIRNHLVD
jgi:DNA-binding NarL/FixJ family response regulator